MYNIHVNKQYSYSVTFFFFIANKNQFWVILLLFNKYEEISAGAHMNANKETERR
jgi:hypothetical protein